MNWIKLRKSLIGDGRVKLLARSLNISELEALGALAKMWCLADTYATEVGVLRGYLTEDLDRHIGISGFCAALPPDWITIPDNDECLIFPDYVAHNGTTTKTRSAATSRKQKERKTQIKSIRPRKRKPLPAYLIRKIIDRDEHSCCYCDRPEGAFNERTESPNDGTLHVDHIFPHSKGGTDDECNLVAACSKCNLTKGEKTLEESGFQLRDKTKTMLSQNFVTPSYLLLSRSYNEKEKEVSTLVEVAPSVFLESDEQQKLPEELSKRRQAFGLAQGPDLTIKAFLEDYSNRKDESKYKNRVKSDWKCMQNWGFKAYFASVTEARSLKQKNLRNNSTNIPDRSGAAERRIVKRSSGNPSSLKTILESSGATEGKA